MDYFTFKKNLTEAVIKENQYKDLMEATDFRGSKSVSITRFSGGNRGLMIQLTATGGKRGVIQMPAQEARVLGKALRNKDLMEGTDFGGSKSVSITRFSGGNRGLMIQLTETGGKRRNIQMPAQEARVLGKALQNKDLMESTDFDDSLMEATDFRGSKSVSITRFSGGNRGLMIQLTETGGKRGNIQMPAQEARVLGKALQNKDLMESTDFDDVK